MFGQFFNSSSSRNGTGVNAALDDKGRTALHFAVEAGNTAEVEKLLRIGAKVNAQDTAGETPLFTAVRNKNIALIEKLLERGATFKVKDDNGVTPLDAAIADGSSVAFIEKLKNLGAVIEIEDDGARTALHTAVDKDATDDILDYLVAEGISVNAKDPAGKTPLHYAVEKNNLSAMKRLLALGADPIVRDNNIETPLHTAARSGKEATADILLALPRVRETINDFKTYQEGFTPLMCAAYSNSAALVEKIAAIGADVNLTDNQNRHALFIAVETGNLDAVKALLKLGSDVGKSPVCTSNKSSILHWINSNNYRTILALLHQAGVDLNAQDGSGYTPLHKACDNFDKDKIRALLDLGANPNIPNEFGKRPLDIILDHYTYDMSNGEEITALLLSRKADPSIAPAAEMQNAPLHSSAMQGRTGTVKLLLAYKAPVDITDRHGSGMTPLMLAAQYGHLDAFKLLQAAGADLSKRDNFARSSLHHAVMGGNTDITDIVMAQPKTDINAKDTDGRTALHHACRLERIMLVEKLLAKNAHPSLYDKNGLAPIHHAAETNSGTVIPLLTGNPSLKIDINMPTRDDGMTALHIAVRDNFEMLTAKLLEMGADPSRAAKNTLLPLHYAILHDRTGMAETLVTGLKRQKKPLDKYLDKNGWTLLHYAATRDTPQIASLLIAAGISPDTKADSGDTSLHIAVRAGKMAVVDYMVSSKSANLAAVNEEGETPLAVAMRLGHEDISKFLMEKIIEQQRETVQPGGLLEFKQANKGPKP